MPAMLRTTAAFDDAYAEVKSDAEAKRIRAAVRALCTFPNSGSAMPRASLVARYGEGIRTYAGGSHVIVYRVEGDAITLLALVPGRLVL